VVSEGTRLRRVIRDEKEPDKDDEVTEHDDENMLGVDRGRDGMSNAGTPRPIDDAPTPLAGLRGSGGVTPRHVANEDVDMDGGAIAEGNQDGRTANFVVEKTGDDMDTT